MNIKCNFYFKSFIAFILIISLLSSSHSAWWDANWIYKQPISIQTDTGTTPINYSFPLYLNSSNVGTNFNWNNECSNNKTRLRIINSNETQELNHWVESCSSTNETMELWVKLNTTVNTTSQDLYMYYQNSGANLKSNASSVFEYYFNFSELIVESENGGTAQDVDGNSQILNDGRTFRTWGNSWKVLSGFGTIPLTNSGDFLLELNLRADDCGEITATLLDTDRGQDGTGYKWCGSQGYATIPDTSYNTGDLGTWQTVSSILNDFSVDLTHIHLPIDDDADASGDVYYKDLRIRTYSSSTINYSFGSEIVIGTQVSSIEPNNNFLTNSSLVTFTCNTVTDNTSQLSNVSLYGNWTGSWQLNETRPISGTTNSTTFTKTIPTIPNSTSSFLWNCEVQDDGGNSDFFDTNYTFTIDRILPNININNPIGFVSDVTPIIDVNFSKLIDRATYSINSGPQIELCTFCNFTNTQFPILREGSYNLTIQANDTIGNINTNTSEFSIALNGNFYDSFLDNSSISIFNSSFLNNGSIVFNGVEKKEYQGIEIGFDDTNMNIIANQLNGASNPGEIDIECPGGDSNCWFTTQNQTNRTGFVINGAVVTEDSDSTTQGFVMYTEENVYTRFTTPTPNPVNPEDFIAVCYNSGQWFYDDNNGCDNPFTPVSTDVLIANVTWGITSLDVLNGTALSGNTTITSNPIQTIENISQITNISWSESNEDGVSNTLDMQLSFDNKTSWINVSNASSITGFSPSTIMHFRAIMSSDGSTQVRLNDINISWNISNQSPQITLITPANNSKIITSNPIQFEWNITDEDSTIDTTLYINSIENQTLICSTNLSCSVNISLNRGLYNWTIQGIDSNGNSTNSTTNYFRVIENYHKTISKEIYSQGSSMYATIFNITNKINSTSKSVVYDYIDEDFSGGSYTPSFNSTSFITGDEFRGDIYTWNRTIFPNSSQNINYLLSALPNTNYSLSEQFIVGGE